MLKEEAEPAALLRVIQEWRNRVVAEYSSAALAADLLHSLIVLGVSPDTLEDCRQIVSDELVHAELSREVALAAGANNAAIELEASRLSIPPGPPLERVLFFASEFFCCGETVARPLFRAMLENAKVPLARDVLERIIKDEARHSAFGWQLLDELLERIDAPLRARLVERVPAHLDRLRACYGSKAGKVAVPLTDEERAWGLLDRQRYEEITEECIAKSLREKYQRRGLA